MTTQTLPDIAQLAPRRHKPLPLWPYYILERNDAELSQDIRSIIDHFEGIDFVPDVVVFVPKAGYHLRKLFLQEFPFGYEAATFTVRRKSSTKPPGIARRYICRTRTLANIFRHVETLTRLIKLALGFKHKREVNGCVDVDITGKRVLIIDDSVDTGTTIQIISTKCSEKGARDVRTACIANQIMPRKIRVDFAMHEYALLRSPTSPDYHAA